MGALCMSEVRFVIANERISSLVREIFSKLPVEERERIGSIISAVTDADLVTAVRPFAFAGRVVHELYFDPRKLSLFGKRERVGAIVAAFIMASLATDTERRFPLDNRALKSRGRQIIVQARRWKYADEVSSFLNEMNFQEDQWKRETTQVSIGKIEKGIKAVTKELENEKDLSRTVTDVRSLLRSNLDVLASWARGDLELCGDAEVKERKQLRYLLAKIKKVRTELASRN